ncbi:MAG: Cof-type HAD-IIB family hydrolase [bacterium]
MNDIRLIASDVDGTMLPRGGVISENLKRAIALCRERGIPFIIASGRWIGAMGDVLAQSGCSGMPLIIANGAAILGGDGQPLREWFLNDADARKVYDILRRFDVQINGYGRGALYCLNTAALKRRSSMIDSYIGGAGHRLVLEDREIFETEGLHNAYKLEALSENPDIIAGVQDALKDCGLSVTHSSARNVEIMAKGVNKGAALTWLADHLQIPAANCMAFGDNMNDYDLLAAAGWPVAVGNADPALKKIARIVAPADVEDGVAKTIFEMILGQ